MYAYGVVLRIKSRVFAGHMNGAHVCMCVTYVLTYRNVRKGVRCPF